MARVAVLFAAASLLATALVSTASLDQAPASPAPQGSAQKPAAPMTDDELAEAGEPATTKICAECHPLERVVASRRTPRDWSGVVTQMAMRGAIGTPAQFALVRDYVTRFYGVVPVNTAAAGDFTAVLGLPVKQAEAIVEYRAANGKFADVSALLKVPGIDHERIEADPDALRFD